RGAQSSPRSAPTPPPRHSLLPDLALVSAARRTRETWDGLAAVLPKPPRALYEERLYNAGRDAIVRVIRDTDRTVRNLIVIGHNPGLHECALALIASGDTESRERLGEALPTCGLVVIDFTVDDWGKLHPQGGRLDPFITPRLLKAATN